MGLENESMRLRGVFGNRIEALISRAPTRVHLILNHRMGEKNIL